MPTKLPQNPVPRSRRFVAALLLACGAPLALFADPVVTRLQENDTFNIQAEGDTATLQLSAERAPDQATGDVQLLARTREFTHWSVPLRQQGDQWVAQIEPAHIEGLLTAEQLLAEFPGAADGEALHLVVPRDRYQAALEGAAGLIQDEALFFMAPEAPPQPQLPNGQLNRAQAETFAAVARQRDRELAAYEHAYAAARARAHALFLDLQTAGRLPWDEETLAQLQDNYSELEQREQQIAQMREQWRTQAQQFVRQWNQNQPEGEPVQLTFETTAATGGGTQVAGETGASPAPANAATGAAAEADAAEASEEAAAE